MSKNINKYILMGALFALGVIVLRALNQLFNQPWNSKLPLKIFYWVAADFLYGIALFGTLLLGVWVGMKTYDRTKSRIISWGLGIIIWFGVSFIALEIFAEIPEIGWRFDKMFNSESY